MIKRSDINIIIGILCGIWGDMLVHVNHSLYLGYCSSTIAALYCVVATIQYLQNK